MNEKYKEYIPIVCKIIFFREDAIRTSGAGIGDNPFQDGNDFGLDDIY